MLLLALIVWSTAMRWGPQYVKAAPSNAEKTAASTVAERVRIDLDTFDVRATVMNGEGLDVFVPRSKLEAVQYPDRAALLIGESKAWCDEAESAYLPAVKFRDLRNGETLATVSCVWGRASIGG